MRYFFALQPPPAIRTQLDELACRCADQQTRLLPPENLHVTLAYLGELGHCSLDAVFAIPENLHYRAFNVFFRQLEFWKKPRIYCLTATAPMVMLELAAELHSRSRSLGFPVAHRPYRPHITLLRKARLPVHRPVPAIGWRADNICLYRSESKDTPGPRYTVLARWPLKTD